MGKAKSMASASTVAVRAGVMALAACGGGGGGGGPAVTLLLPESKTARPFAAACRSAGISG